MRRIERLSLKPASVAVLHKMQASVGSAANPKLKAANLWDRKTASRPRKAAFEDVRTKLKRMSTGLERCMYCEDSAGTDIDHFRPKAPFPAHAFRWANYLHACSHCNSNQKRSAFPTDPAGLPLLLDPTSEDPYQHLQFVWQTGEFVGQTSRGMETETVFGLNTRALLQKGRRNTWLEIEALLEKYRLAPTHAERKRIREVVREKPFQAVVQHFLRDAIARRPNVPAAIAAEVIATQAHWAWAL